MKKLLLAAAFAVAMTGSAFASSCPGLMQKIDAALETASISDEDKATVMELRAQGEEEHEAGDHDASVATLNEALKLLGM